MSRSLAVCLLACISLVNPIGAGKLRAQDTSSLALASSSQFAVGEIRIEGLQRISEGTVFNYLPINIGDAIDSRRLGEAIRALYGTGFFKDVELRRDGTPRH